MRGPTVVQDTKVCRRCGVEQPIASFGLAEGKYRRGTCYRCKGRGERKPQPPTRCAWCGVVFQPKEPRFATYCTRECGWQGQARDRRDRFWIGRFSPLPFRTCIECGVEFYSRSRRRLCGEECQRARARRLTYEASGGDSKHPVLGLVCPECGQQVAYQRFNNERVYCSRGCTKRAGKARRRAWKRGAALSPVSRAKVYRRDGWLCQLCRLPVDPSLRSPDPGSASLDHIHPLSRGGEHSMRNVQLAHLGCNRAKGDELSGGRGRKIASVTSSP